MGKNIHDLNRSVNKIQEGLDRRSEERGRDAADRFVSSTRSGGKFWLVFIYPIAFTLSMLAFNIVAVKLGFDSNNIPYLVLLAVGAMGAGSWWTGK